MDIQFNCYECIHKQTLTLANKIGQDANSKAAAYVDLANIVNLCISNKVTPPEVAALCYDYFESKTKIKDLFRDIKDKSTALALELYPLLEELVKTSKDEFTSRVLLAIAGNVIDFGATPDFKLSNAKEEILKVFTQPYNQQNIDLLHQKLDNAKNVLYILDNCGEAVIDRLLIEQYAQKISIVVRGRPIMNDITKEDVKLSKLDFVPVYDTGTNIPGVNLTKSSLEFLTQYRKADLIIAKGQGNFESFYDYVDKEAFFLFRVKCPVISQYLNKEPGSIEIRTKNI
jgi:uncharacterized protein with ATP-grasp and redox domains